jgi:hypothetical protein
VEKAERFVLWVKRVWQVRIYIELELKEDGRWVLLLLLRTLLYFMYHPAGKLDSCCTTKIYLLL